MSVLANFLIELRDLCERWIKKLGYPQAKPAFEQWYKCPLCDQFVLGKKSFIEHVRQHEREEKK